MGVALDLAPTDVVVAPGAEVFVALRVHNVGEVVDQVDLTVLGNPTDWCRVEPERVNLLPGQSEHVRLTFAPPRSWTVPAGDHYYAVRAASREDPENSEILEGRVTVEAFSEIVAEVVPAASRAPRAGHHDLAVDNLGNQPRLLNLAAASENEALEFRWARAELLAEPGTATLVHLRARPTTRFLRGPDRALPFDVVVSDEDGPVATAPGAVRQRAILAPGVARLVLLVVALIVLWAAFVRPRLNRVDAAVARTANQTAQALAPAQKQLNDSPQAQAQRSEAAQAKATGTGAADGGTGLAPTAPAPVAKPPTAGKPAQRAASAAPTPSPPGTAAVAPTTPVAVSFRMTLSTSGSQAGPLPGTPGYLQISQIDIHTDPAGGGTLQIRFGGPSSAATAGTGGATLPLVIPLGGVSDLSYKFDQPLVFTAQRPLEVVDQCGKTCRTTTLLFTGRATLPFPAPPGSAPNPAPAPTTPTTVAKSPTPKPTTTPSRRPNPTPAG